ncbi:hypothetical protein HanRHA438_Chr10g0468371 [Helianthus annuus]|nr:hypothetical protein HanRHA438_Chr10g0468371 [Helianthus annuus]
MRFKVLNVHFFFCFILVWMNAIRRKGILFTSISCILTIPRTNVKESSFGASSSGLGLTFSPHVSVDSSSMEFMPVANKPAIDKKSHRQKG